MKIIIRNVGGAFLGLLVLLGPASALAVDTSDCRQVGGDSGLGQSEVQRLCRGASTPGPIECFQRVRTTIALGTDDAIQLCRCARSTGPADCVIEMIKSAHAGERDALLSCESPGRRTSDELHCRGLTPPLG
jgi:hypothetical protein